MKTSIWWEHLFYFQNDWKTVGTNFRRVFIWLHPATRICLNSSVCKRHHSPSPIFEITCEIGRYLWRLRLRLEVKSDYQSIFFLFLRAKTTNHAWNKPNHHYHHYYTCLTRTLFFPEWEKVNGLEKHLKSWLQLTDSTHPSLQSFVKDCDNMLFPTANRALYIKHLLHFATSITPTISVPIFQLFHGFLSNVIEISDHQKVIFRMHQSMNHFSLKVFFKVLFEMLLSSII